jgi:type IV pilus assembly protein PilX
MVNRRPTLRDERGIALVVALLVMLVLSLLALVLMTTVSVERKIAGHTQRETASLNTAEAGIAEALSRIKSGDIAMNLNPKAVAQIYNCVAGSVPVPGTTDSTFMATDQPAGQWLNYSTATRGPNVLQVNYRTDAGQTVIYKYDSTQNPAVQTTTGFPIFQVTSTGLAGADRSKVVAEFIQKPINVNAKGALVAGVGIDFSGTSFVCGFNHTMSTPPGTASRPPCDTYELGTGMMPGAWSSGAITTSGAAVQDGSPPTSQNQVGFYTGPWDCFNMSQSSFFSWVGPSVPTEPANPTGIFYLDNDATPENQSGSFKYNGGTGAGFLYVDGDLSINGNFIYTGLIYITGDLKINGTCWILGSLVVRGKTTIKIANGNCAILYSADAIQQTVSQYGGQFVNISWRQL